MAAVQKTEIVADIVREDGLQLGTEDVPMPRGRDILILDQNRGRDVAEDEMAVAVAPVQMPRTNLGVHDEHALRMAGADIIGGGLDAEGSRRTGDIQVDTESIDAERVLHLDRHRRIRTDKHT